MTKYVLISGKKQNGKDYFGSVLVKMLQEQDKLVVQTAFASPIKNFCADVFGIDHGAMATEEGKQRETHLLWDDINPEIADGRTGPMTIREILQIVGTDVWRTRFYGPIWAEAPFRKKFFVKSDKYSGYGCKTAAADVVIITDCRFPNELEEGLKHDAVLVRIDGGKPSTDTHASETALDDYPWDDRQLFKHNFEGREPIVEFIFENVFPKLGL